MTKEEIIEECEQRLGFETDYEMYSLCQHEKDFYNAIIKALEQPTSDDCVSRQAAIKTLNCEINGSIVSNIDLSKYRREFQEFANMILNAQEKAIRELPPLTPTQRWISISERLPEDGTWNLFTDGKKISIERYKLDAIDHFYPSGRFFSLEEAIAWQPLPQPYEEKRGDENGGN